MERHLGWSNKETWAMHYHLSTDPSSQAYIEEARDQIFIEAKASPEPEKARDSFETWLRETMEALWETHPINLSDESWRFIKNVGSLWRVNWREVSGAFLGDRI